MWAIHLVQVLAMPARLGTLLSSRGFSADLAATGQWFIRPRSHIAEANRHLLRCHGFFLPQSTDVALKLNDLQFIV